MITIALSKGRILPKHCRSWQLPVVVPLEDPETSRKLLIGTKPSGYPNCGACGAPATFRLMSNTALQTWGVAGKDSLYEHGGAGLYVPLDLNIAKCRMCVACPRDFDYHAKVRRGARLRIANQVHEVLPQLFCKRLAYMWI